MRLKSVHVLLVGLVVLLAVLGGASKDSGAATKTTLAITKTTLTISVAGEPPTLDLTKTPSTFAVWPLLYNVLEPLVQTETQHLMIKPLLAQSWTVSKDGKTYIFTLRKGAKFSTGAPVTASDVVFSYKMMSAATSPHAARFVPMTSVRALNKRTVKVVLSKRSNAWLSNMSERAGVVFSKADFGTIAEKPIGSGPYKIDKWQRGDSIQLVKNTQSNAPKTSLSRVTYKFIADPNAAVNALKAGNVDVVENLIARDQAAGLRSSGFVVSPDATPRVHALFLRNDVAPLNNLGVRRAISYAIDKKALVNALSGGYGTAVGSWITRSDRWYAKFENYPYSVAKAKETLAAAGYPKGIDLPMTVIANNISAQQGELVALMLREAGIRVKLQTVDVATFLDQVLGKGKFVSGIVAAATPSLIVNFANGNGWFTGWNNAKFNQKIAAADTAATPKARNALYREAAHLLADDAPIVPFYNDVNLTVKPKALKGWPGYRVDQVLDVRKVRWAG